MNEIRLIDANALEKSIDSPPYTLYNGSMRCDWVEECIKNAPTIEAEPVRHGEWSPENTRPRSPKFICSECGEVAQDRAKGAPRRDPPKKCSLKFCPNCGAKMDGESGQ